RAMVDYVFRVGGEGGEGVISTGEMLTIALARAGFEIYTFRTYPAEIKGGHCWYQVRSANEEVLSAGTGVDCLCAFNQEAIDKHLASVGPGGVVVYDPGQVSQVPERPEVILYDIPFDELVKEKVQSPKSKNVFAVAVVMALYGVPADEVKKTTGRKFRGKNPKLIELNEKAIDAAYEYVATLERKHATRLTVGEHDPDRMLLNGNEAVSLGALYAGIDFYAGYPITPASSILESLAVEMPKLGRPCIQAEDEMSALAHCLGASYAGKKAMTATSGPGFSLMQELLGLGSTAELPVVIVNCMRGGPSTGLPTKPEQSDLNEVVYGSHGEASRIVLAPTGVRDCFVQTVWAFNLAERYQVPVILATDHSLTVRTENLPVSSLKGVPIWNRKLATAADLVDYKRYQFTPDGVSPIALPGMKGGVHVAEGLEHNEYGNPNYTGANHEAMVRKRLGKIDDAWKYPGAIERFGDENPDLLVVTWGSTKGPAKEAVVRALQEGRKVGYLIPKILNPLPQAGFMDLVAKAPQVLVAEMNHTGQLEGLLRKHVGRHFERLNKVQGTPMTWLEIYEKMDALLAPKAQRATVKSPKPKEMLH
ncbi:MAG TPA: 2-oxoacid:acceptor oxidoreductase subunit alpha, partial [Candidatus Thermoplasmatota archaeon]|nr:2-oxoacid:acceptor oxidoreductase subunit alpha [Candidatus Thermoplasmatota archaeon]